MLRPSSRCIRWQQGLTTPSQRCIHPALPTIRRGHASVTNPDQSPQLGESLHGFMLKRKKHVPELQLTAFQLEHEKTGAEYLHIARDDKNNVFSVGFKTNPPDHTGVPHILEHTTLCGSQNYPVRDPFFKMLPRSLSNFMNAFTSSDYTSYPFATTNQQDFKNLLSVYLDATLHPLLKENDFTQEGWRIGPENPKAIASGHSESGIDDKLVFKGVVYNEMKGMISDASYLYHIKFQNQIFPDINYSGGDPQKMTDLTYQDLKDFHSKNYRPTNSKIFTYGDMPLSNHLQEVGQQLDRFERTQADEAVKTPMSLDNGPLYYTVKGPADPLVDKDMQYKISTSWLMGDTSDIVETFSLGIMSSLLLEGYGSPLYQALIEAGLGPDWSPNTGYDSAGKIGIFSIGLNGVKEADLPKVKEAIQFKLLEVHQKHFDKAKVDGYLHQLELALKHKTASFGMGLMQRVQPAWFNGADPFDALAWNDTVTAFKQRFSEEDYLEGLLEKYLLNDRTLTFVMEPSDTYGDELAVEETTRLAAKISEATMQAGGEAEAQKQLTARELELLEVQEKASDEDVSCLPSVHVKDIPRQMERKPVRDSTLGDVNIQWREASTNGLTYFRAINTFAGLPSELRMLIPLFNDSIMRLGTKDMTMEQLEDLIKLKTGGISTSYHASSSPTDRGASVEGLSLSGTALDGNVPAMYELLRTLLQETNFDGPEAESKIRQLLQADANGALDSVSGSGHSYARTYAAAGLSRHGLLSEQIGGLTQIQHTGDLANRSSVEGLADVIAKLKAIQNFAVSNSSNFRAALTCGQESVSSNEAALRKFLLEFPRSTSIPKGDASVPLDTSKPATFFPLPYQVYYSALAIPTVSYTHASGAPLQVLSHLLTHKHLHHEIREKGGAYGGGAYSRGLSGVFGYYSYRDPNPLNTLKIIRDAGRWARDNEWTSQNIEEAKLSVFQAVDSPESVSEEGMARFVNGVDEVMEQTKREQLLDVKKEDIREVAQRYLMEGMKDARIAVLGDKKDWVRGEAGWTIKSLELSRASESAGASDLSPDDLGHA